MSPLVTPVPVNLVHIKCIYMYPKIARIQTSTCTVQGGERRVRPESDFARLCAAVMATEKPSDGQDTWRRPLPFPLAPSYCLC